MVIPNYPNQYQGQQNEEAQTITNYTQIGPVIVADQRVKCVVIRGMLRTIMEEGQQGGGTALIHYHYVTEIQL